MYRLEGNSFCKVHRRVFNLQFVKMTKTTPGARKYLAVLLAACLLTLASSRPLCLPKYGGRAHFIAKVTETAHRMGEYVYAMGCFAAKVRKLPSTTADFSETPTKERDCIEIMDIIRAMDQCLKKKQRTVRQDRLAVTTRTTGCATNNSRCCLYSLEFIAVVRRCFKTECKGKSLPSPLCT